MIRRFPIRLRLATAVAVPIAILTLLAAVQVLQVRQAAREANEQAELAFASAGVDSLLGRLQMERNVTGLWLRDTPVAAELGVENLAEARALTDEALETFEATIEGRISQIQDAYGPALDTIAGADDLPGLDDVRSRVDRYSGERSFTMDDPVSPETFAAYGDLIALLVEGNARTSRLVDDGDLRDGVALVGHAVDQTDTIAQLVRQLLVRRVDSSSPFEDIATVASLVTRLQANDDGIRAEGDGRYRPLVDELYSSPDVQRLPEILQVALSSDTVDSFSIGELFDVTTPSDTADLSYRTFSVRVSDELESQATSLADDAERSQRLYLALALAVVLFAGLVTWLVSRSITSPLRSLIRQAKDMADHRLPDAVSEILSTPLGEDVSLPRAEPVEVAAGGEVADVAGALNTVQDSALNLAVEQAVLRRNIADTFISLGQRNQRLLGRQIDFITELEQGETDPDTLANLFRLDHLATRMRRNAESLLVLAGVDAPRTWTATVSITDVIRAALGEVEDFQRVSSGAVQPATLVGSAVADLVHLLAELIENALEFSPSDRAVEVQGSLVSTGYTLGVIDAGRGMPPEEIAAANRRLAGAEPFTIAPSKHLGHYVAGRLAARHGVKVQIRSSGAGTGLGITALVGLPSRLLTTEAPAGPHHLARNAPGGALPASPGRALAAPRDESAKPSATGWLPPLVPDERPGPAIQPLPLPPASPARPVVPPSGPAPAPPGSS